MRNGTDAKRNGCETERMGLKCGTDGVKMRNGTDGVKMRKGTDMGVIKMRNGYGVKMRNGTNMRLKLNLKPISVPFCVLTPYPFRSAF